MKLGELINQLNDIKADLVHHQDMSEHDAENVDVRLAFQPHWPLQYNIGQVTTNEVDLGGCIGECDTCPDNKYCDMAFKDHGNEEGLVVYIAEAGQVSNAPYLPRAACRALDWG